MNLIQQYDDALHPWQKEPDFETFMVNGRVCHIYRGPNGVLHGIVGFSDFEVDYFFMKYSIPSSHNGRPVREYKSDRIMFLPEEHKDVQFWCGISGTGPDNLIPKFAKFSFGKGLVYYTLEQMRSDLISLVPICASVVEEEKRKRNSWGR